MPLKAHDARRNGGKARHIRNAVTMQKKHKRHVCNADMPLRVKIHPRLFFSLGNRNLAELLEELAEFEGSLTSTRTGSLVVFLHLSGCVYLESCNLLVDLFYQIFHNFEAFVVDIPHKSIKL